MEIKMLSLLKVIAATWVVCLASSTAAFAASAGGGAREIGDGVYSFTLG
jgi:hypothetical protein